MSVVDESGLVVTHGGSQVDTGNVGIALHRRIKHIPGAADVHLHPAVAEIKVVGSGDVGDNSGNAAVIQQTACDFANYLADFVANYLAKIGELFGNFQLSTSKSPFLAASRTSGVIIWNRFSFCSL